jgi:cellulose biosynthesis protein BcsQ
MPYIITITNHKGSVGRTTTVVNLSACFAKSGRRLLIVNVNSHANCTSHFGIDPEDVRLNAYHTLIEPESDIRKNFVSNCFFPIYKNVRGIDASIKGVPVIELDPSCCASHDYFRLSHEVIHEL